MNSLNCSISPIYQNTKNKTQYDWAACWSKSVNHSPKQLDHMMPPNKFLLNKLSLTDLQPLQWLQNIGLCGIEPLDYDNEMLQNYFYSRAHPASEHPVNLPQQPVIPNPVNVNKRKPVNDANKCNQHRGKIRKLDSRLDKHASSILSSSFCCPNFKTTHKNLEKHALITNSLNQQFLSTTMPPNSGYYPHKQGYPLNSSNHTFGLPEIQASTNTFPNWHSKHDSYSKNDDLETNPPFNFTHLIAMVMEQSNSALKGLTVGEICLLVESNFDQHRKLLETSDNWHNLVVNNLNHSNYFQTVAPVLQHKRQKNFEQHWRINPIQRSKLIETIKKLFGHQRNWRDSSTIQSIADTKLKINNTSELPIKWKQENGNVYPTFSRKINDSSGQHLSYTNGCKEISAELLAPTIRQIITPAPHQDHEYIKKDNIQACKINFSEIDNEETWRLNSSSLSIDQSSEIEAALILAQMQQQRL